MKQEHQRENEPRDIDDVRINEIVMEHAYRDYARLQSVYDNVYTKVNILLVFIGVFMELTFRSVNIQSLMTSTKNMTVGVLILYMIDALCAIASIVCPIVAVLLLLKILLGRSISVFRCEGMESQDFENRTGTEKIAWLKEKYIKVAKLLRPVNDSTQKTFKIAVSFTIVGVVTYAFHYLFIQIGGVT